MPAPLITFESIVTPIAPTTEIPFRRAAEKLLFRIETGPAYPRPFARPVTWTASIGAPWIFSLLRVTSLPATTTP